MRKLLTLVFAVLAAIQVAFAAVDLNSASETELDGLPGVGPAKAKAIVADRQENGPFKSVDDLKRVKGIGDKMLDKLKGQVTVGGVADLGQKSDSKPAEPGAGTARPKPAGAQVRAPAGAKAVPAGAKRAEDAPRPAPAGTKPAGTQPAPAGLKPAGTPSGTASASTAKAAPDSPAAGRGSSGGRPAGGSVPAPAGAKGQPGKDTERSATER